MRRKATRAAAFAIAWLVAISPSVSSGPFDDGVAAYHRGDYGAALRAWTRAAEQGDVNAQTNLGFMHEHGDGVARDLAVALKWYRLAAERGGAIAQHNLGVLYGLGHGVPQDRAEAARWYGRAAEQGYPRAQHNLAVLYEHGEGVPKDPVRAHMWFELAALHFGARTVDGLDAAADRDRLAASMTAAQVAQAKALAQEWLAVTEGREP